jgi:hypothetical protein
MKTITKRLKDEIFAWDPKAFSGKGYWFVLGTKGGLGRAASKAEVKKLGIPKTEEPKTEKSSTIKSVIEKVSSDDKIGKRINPDKITKSIEKMTGNAEVDATTKTKQNTVANKSIIPDTLENIQTALHTKVSEGQSTQLMRKGDGVATILSKLFLFLKKSHQEETKRYEIENNFHEQRQKEKQKWHDELIYAITGSNVGGTTVVKVGEEKTEDSLLSKIGKFVLDIIDGTLKGIDRFFKGLKPLLGFLTTIGAGILGALASFLLSPLGLTLLTLFTVGALATMISHYLTKWAREEMPDLKQETLERIGNELVTGDDKVIMSRAELITGQKPKDINEAEEIVRNHLKNASGEARRLLEERDIKLTEVNSLEKDFKEIAERDDEPAKKATIAQNLSKAKSELKDLEIQIAKKGGSKTLSTIASEGSVTVGARQFESPIVVFNRSEGDLKEGGVRDKIREINIKKVKDAGGTAIISKESEMKLNNLDYDDAELGKFMKSLPSPNGVKGTVIPANETVTPANETVTPVPSSNIVRGTVTPANETVTPVPSSSNIVLSNRVTSATTEQQDLYNKIKGTLTPVPSSSNIDLSNRVTSATTEQQDLYNKIKGTLTPLVIDNSKKVIGNSNQNSNQIHIESIASLHSDEPWLNMCMSKNIRLT